MARNKKTDSDTESETYDDTEKEPDATDAVLVEITADHIYLPLDEDGNVSANWREAGATTRVEKGTKLTVPADLIEQLTGRVARVA